MSADDPTVGNISREEYALVRGEALKDGVTTVLPMQKVEITGSHGDVYTLSDAADGMKRFTGNRGLPVTMPFYLSPETEVFAFDSDGNGDDEIYLSQAVPGGLPVLVDPSLKSPELPQKKFRLKIPYDVDLQWDDGCYGRDFGVEPDPVMLLWDGGAFTINYDEENDFILASKVSLRRKNGMPVADQSKGAHPLLNEGVRTEEGVLLCAYRHYTGRAMRHVLRGALFFLRNSRPYDLEPEEGPRVFMPVDIEFSYGWRKISIRSEMPLRMGKPVTEVVISMHGWNFKKDGPDIHINRRGEVFSYDRGRVNFRPVSKPQIELLIRAIHQKMEEEKRAGNVRLVESIKVIADILGEHPYHVYPPWLFR